MISTWHRKHPHAAGQGPGRGHGGTVGTRARANVGSLGSACAQLLGIHRTGARSLGPGSPLSNARRSLGRLPRPGPLQCLPSRPSVHAGRQHTQGIRYRALSVPAPPGSMGVCSSLGVVVGEYLPAMWAPRPPAQEEGPAVADGWQATTVLVTVPRLSRSPVPGHSVQRGPYVPR